MTDEQAAAFAAQLDRIESKVDQVLETFELYRPLIERWANNPAAKLLASRRKDRLNGPAQA